MLAQDTRLLDQSQRTLLLIAQWPHDLQIYTGSLFLKSHGGDVENLRGMQLTRVTNSLLCPKLKGFWYSGLCNNQENLRQTRTSWSPVLVTQNFVPWLRCPELRKHQTFKGDCRQICPTFALEKDIIFIILDSKQLCPLPQKETLSLSSKAVCHTNTLEKIF